MRDWDAGGGNGVTLTLPCADAEDGSCTTAASVGDLPVPAFTPHLSSPAMTSRRIDRRRPSRTDLGEIQSRGNARQALTCRAPGLLFICEHSPGDLLQTPEVCVLALGGAGV